MNVEAIIVEVQNNKDNKSINNTNDKEYCNRHYMTDYDTFIDNHTNSNNVYNKEDKNDVECDDNRCKYYKGKRVNATSVNATSVDDKDDSKYCMNKCEGEGIQLDPTPLKT